MHDDLLTWLLLESRRPFPTIDARSRVSYVDVDGAHVLGAHRLTVQQPLYRPISLRGFRSNEIFALVERLAEGGWWRVTETLPDGSVHDQLAHQSVIPANVESTPLIKVVPLVEALPRFKSFAEQPAIVESDGRVSIWDPELLAFCTGAVYLRFGTIASVDAAERSEFLSALREAGWHRDPLMGALLHPSVIRHLSEQRAPQALAATLN